MQHHGWTLLFHDCLIDPLRKLEAAATRAQRQDPGGAASNANVKLFRALSQLMLEAVLTDPNREAYRQGNTLGGARCTSQGGLGRGHLIGSLAGPHRSSPMY